MYFYFIVPKKTWTKSLNVIIIGEKVVPLDYVTKFICFANII